MTSEHHFIEAAMSVIGSPYIWGGKGEHLFDVQKGLVGSPYIEEGKLPLLVFDCSGLVTWALKQATGRDKRGAWNTQIMFDGCLPFGRLAEEPHHAALRFYGTSPKHITHVAIWLGVVDGRPLLLEAAGGDRSTTNVLEAQRTGAKVRCGFERRRDVQGMRVLPLY